MADLAMDGSRYRARVRLSTRANVTVADVGQTCERVKASSLSWLLAQRLIEPAPPADPHPQEEDDDAGR